MHLYYVAIDVATESALLFIQIDDVVYLQTFISALSNLI
jgi:hypothetical protein